MSDKGNGCTTVDLLKQSAATGTPILAGLLLLYSTLSHDMEDVRERERASERSRERIEQRLREIQTDVDRVERRTRSLKEKE